MHEYQWIETNCINNTVVRRSFHSLVIKICRIKFMLHTISILFDLLFVVMVLSLFSVNCFKDYYCSKNWFCHFLSSTSFVCDFRIWIISKFAICYIPSRVRSAIWKVCLPNTALFSIHALINGKVEFERQRSLQKSNQIVDVHWKWSSTPLNLSKYMSNVQCPHANQ